MRHRKTDAHIATIRVSVPIAAMDAASVSKAAEAINGLRAHLPPGSAVEVLNSRFGRVDAPVAAEPPKQIDMMQALKDAVISDTMADIKAQVQNGAGDPELPDSLRRTA